MYWKLLIINFKMVNFMVLEFCLNKNRFGKWINDFQFIFFMLELGRPNGLGAMAEVVGGTRTVWFMGQWIFGNCISEGLDKKCLLQTFLIKPLPPLTPLQWAGGHLWGCSGLFIYYSNLGGEHPLPNLPERGSYRGSLWLMRWGFAGKQNPAGCPPWWTHPQWKGRNTMKEKLDLYRCVSAKIRWPFPARWFCPFSACCQGAWS